MKPIDFSLVVAIALAVGGHHWIENAKQNAIRLRELKVQHRDEWIADRIDGLKNGEPSAYLYSGADTNLLLEKIEGMPKVQRIVFEQTIDVSAKGLRYLPSFPNLRHLDFRGEKALNNEQELDWSFYKVSFLILVTSYVGLVTVFGKRRNSSCDICLG